MCLTKNRPEMLARAVDSFKAQTYKDKWLLILDTGAPSVLYESDDVYHEHVHELDYLTIGALRNNANGYTDPAYHDWSADIICHWDDDDYSHPNRIAEQVALLQASGADAVGYSDMLFWREPQVVLDVTYRHGEAWLYLGPQKALGTSLCYWRKTWQRKQFPDQPRPGFASGEDTDWIKGLNLVSVSSLVESEQDRIGYITPRMIASIHCKNTSGSYRLMEHSDSWRRVPEWDSYCRKVMCL
jgi:glycosyltransferase involved in cell wall biosynthesis